MAIQSPALSVGLATLFGDIRPALDVVKRLGGSYDFSDGPDGIVLAPAGETVKVPISSVNAAGVYNATTNNYFTGADTDWASMTPTLYLKGFDISGVDVDKGCDAKKFENLFTRRASKSIGAAILAAVPTVFGAPVSTSRAYTIADLMQIGAEYSWLDKSRAALVVNGATFGKIKAAFATAQTFTKQEITEALGFREIVVMPCGADEWHVIPDGAFGMRAAVPTAVAKYAETGVETDEESGFSVGIKVANDEAHNRIIVNVDCWFGMWTIMGSSSAPGLVDGEFTAS